MVLLLSFSVAESVAKLTNIINNSFGRYFGCKFDAEGIQWLFRSQIATTHFRSLNLVTKLLFSCSGLGEASPGVGVAKVKASMVPPPDTHGKERPWRG